MFVVAVVVLVVVVLVVVVDSYRVTLGHFNWTATSDVVPVMCVREARASISGVDGRDPAIRAEPSSRTSTWERECE